MKYFIIMTLIGGLVFSCTKEAEETYSYTFEEDAQLVIEPPYEGSYMKYSKVVPGSALVFTYKKETEGEKKVADDEFTEIIRFEIEPTLSEFSYSDNELSDLKAVYSISCFCSFDDPLKNTLPQGTISGKKISETQWDISIDVTFYTDDQKNITNTFRLEK